MSPNASPRRNLTEEPAEMQVLVLRQKGPAEIRVWKQDVMERLSPPAEACSNIPPHERR